MGIIYADWPAAAHIVAGVTDRSGGCSTQGFSSNNMALHVGDDAKQVLQNRQQLKQQLIQDDQLSTNLKWQWLNQVHGVAVTTASASTIEAVPDADAAVTQEHDLACSVMTADCLPILLSDAEGTTVAAIHAGWRSLCHGIIENTVARMKEKLGCGELMAWFGPAIGATQFEVGLDVYQAFQQGAVGDFSVQAFSVQDDGKYLADIYQLAQLRLQHCGVDAFYGGQFCTVLDNKRFYSYRRDGQTGRMASFIVRKSPQ
ncbi:MAG: peptidoglycan editing factor PgeF [Pseudomonadales bacterium]|nr:peptidoglycan editing factor PgeF [Pseudomonadales bacterium]